MVLADPIPPATAEKSPPSNEVVGTVWVPVISWRRVTLSKSWKKNSLSLPVRIFEIQTGPPIENPYLLKTATPQPRDEQKHIQPAAQLRAGMLEVERLGDAWLGREQFLRAARRRRQERHAAPRRGRSDGADERKMPDDVADTRFDLDDRARRHIDCRVKGCDMPF